MGKYCVKYQEGSWASVQQLFQFYDSEMAHGESFTHTPSEHIYNPKMTDVNRIHVTIALLQFIILEAVRKFFSLK